MDSGLEIRLFGGWQFILNGSPLTGFPSHKVAALLAYVAVERRPHSREALAALLWGGLPDVDARNNLRQALTHLRKIVGPYLVIDRETVAFGQAQPYTVDVETFLECLAAGEQLALERRVEKWQAAGDLYVGDFLAGFPVRDAPEYEEWLLAQRARFRELALHTLHRLSERLAASGEFERAIVSATRLLALDPWREETHRQLMRLKARTGQRSAAIAQYELCRQVLERELGVEPAVETTALAERLRAAQRRPRHNLPGSLTGFVGREGETALLVRRFADPACRLVTLTGPGGIGKTRFALRLAETLAETYINGAWFVPLSGASSTDLIEHLADSIGLTLRAGNIKQQLLNTLRARELLLILDNFEHLVESAGLLSDILQAAPDVRLLVTSRERLDLKSEWVFALDGLALPTDVETNPEEYAAGQLFMQVVEHRRPLSNASRDEARAIQEICQLMGGLPLGIELAAARAQSLTCSATAAEIRRGANDLATRQRDVPERQRSLRAVVESSIAALSTEERRVFVALAVFPRAFTSEAAATIAGATPTRLAALVDKSLLRQVGGRYDLHEVLRRFALESLEQDPARHAELCGRHCRYFAALMPTLAGPDATFDAGSAWMAAMANDFDNLRAAWAWASAQHQSSEIALMLEGVFRFMNVRGHYREGVDWFSLAGEAFAPDPRAIDERGRLAMRLSVARARFSLELGQADVAVPLFETGRLYFEGLAEPRQLARCLNGLGTAARARGQFAQARGYCAALLDVARAHDLRDDIAGALNNLGVVVSDMGDYTEAIRLHRECLNLRRELGDQVGIASSLINLATALVDQGDDTQTMPLLHEALAISREFNDARRTGAVLTNLGAAARRAGRLDDERSYYRQALAVHRESGHRLGVALALNNLGSVAARLGEVDEGRRSLRAALVEAQEGRFDFVALDAFVWLALLTSAAGDRLRALEWLALPLHDPSADGETVVAAQALLTEISEGQSAASVANALERGRARSLTDAVRDALEAD